MRLLLAIFLPWLQFFTIGRPVAGVLCLLLQITLIGWIPAAIWSVYALSQYETDKKIGKALADRRLQRAQDRSRRAMNPENYDEQGRARKGRRLWKKSERYKARQAKLADMERRLVSGWLM